MSTPRQGEVWDYHGTVARVRVLILTDRMYNTGADPLAALVRRAGDIYAPPFLVATGETDPVSGLVDLTQTARLLPKGLVAPVGILTGPTWALVDRGVRLMFGLAS